MSASVVDAISALNSGDASALAKLMAQRRVQRRKPARGKRKAKKKSEDEVAEAEEDADEDSTAQVDDELRALPREQLDAFYPAAVQLVAPSDDEEEEASRLKARECIAEFTALLVEMKGVSIDKEELFAVCQELHDQLLRLKGDTDQVLATQEAISQLCEACWKHNFCGRAHSLVTQLLPYLIVRSYESPPTGSFNSKKHPIRRLFAIKDALPLLDFDDDSSGLLRDILLRCFIQPTFFRSPDAVPFLSFLFTLHVPFVEDINETIRNQIPNQRNSILVKYGNIYFKAWVGSKGAFREKIEEECIQRYVRDAVHAGSTSLFNAVRSVLQIFFENKRHPGVDEMLYRICSPILWRGVKAPNDSVRRQSTILLFDNFPLRDPAFNNEMMDVTLQKQFDTFEELLSDSHPALRVAAIEGVSKVLSVYWELLPAETIRCFISKFVVDLVNDTSSSSVRAAVFEGIQFILDNHNSHSILKPLLPMLAPLINDRNEKVRAEFGALLVRIKSIRNLHFYDVVSVNDLLCRMVMDRDSPLACKQLVSLFLNSYFPQSVGGSSQVARCLALVRKNPEAAMVFYANVIEHVSVGSVCKLAALLLRCSLNFVSRRLKQPQESEDDDEEDEEEEEEEGFSVVGQVVVLEVIGNLLKSVHVKVLSDARYSECKSFLREQLNVESLKALLLAYSENRPHDQEALSSIWKIIGFLGDLSEGVLLERLVENLMKMNENSNRKLVESMVDCMVQWDQLPFLTSKLEKFLDLWRKNKFRFDIAGSKSKKNKKAELNPVVVLGTIEYIAQLPNVKSLNTLLQPIVEMLHRCIEPILEFDVDEAEQAYKTNSFGFIRLIEVYAKVAVMAECAHVNDETSLLVEKAAKRLKKKDDLRDLQPSEFFTPPKSLCSLFAWLARLMLDLRKEVEGTEQTTHGKKRRRGKKADDEQLSPQKELLSRWRNLFSLVSLLSAESVAFALERTHWLQNGPAADFIDAYVDTLCGTLRDMELFERTVLYQTAQLAYLLERVRVKAIRATRAQAANLVPSLEHWIDTLQQALESTHEKNKDKCDDLWPTISASFREQCAVETSAVDETAA
ncbi:Condensin II non structural maintenance of chromosomes subunit [Phytophthora infestans]|nr:Condensin II non structural maintenance of chromosomes subunit [Phytophthora infestans]